MEQRVRSPRIHQTGNRQGAAPPCQDSDGVAGLILSQKCFPDQQRQTHWDRRRGVEEGGRGGRRGGHLRAQHTAATLLGGASSSLCLGGFSAPPAYRTASYSPPGWRVLEGRRAAMRSQTCASFLTALTNSPACCGSGDGRHRRGPGRRKHFLPLPRSHVCVRGPKENTSSRL